MKVTVVEPPQAAGAPVLLLVKTPLQPPLADAVANQLVKAAFTEPCVWQAATVVLVGQVNEGAGTTVMEPVAFTDPQPPMRRML